MSLREELERLEEREGELEAALLRRRSYKPGMYLRRWNVPYKKPLAEEFIEEIEVEGEEEEAYKKFLRKMLRQPGATKKTSEAYLRRVLEKAIEEGRI